MARCKLVPTHVALKSYSRRMLNWHKSKHSSNDHGVEHAQSDKTSTSSISKIIKPLQRASQSSSLSIDPSRLSKRAKSIHKAELAQAGEFTASQATEIESVLASPDDEDVQMRTPLTWETLPSEQETSLLLHILEDTKQPSIRADLKKHDEWKTMMRRSLGPLYRYTALYHHLARWCNIVTGHPAWGYCDPRYLHDLASVHLTILEDGVDHEDCEDMRCFMWRRILRMWPEKFADAFDRLKDIASVEWIEAGEIWELHRSTVKGEKIDVEKAVMKLGTELQEMGEDAETVRECMEEYGDMMRQAREFCEIEDAEWAAEDAREREQIIKSVGSMDWME